MADLPNPLTRNEQYLNAIATGDPSGLPDPLTREEIYLDYIAENGGGGGGGTGEVKGVKGDIEESYRKNNVNLTLANITNIGNGLTYNDTTKTLLGTQYSTIPTPANLFINKVIQYVGEDAGDYVSGRFYKCINNGSDLVWVEVDMGGETDALTTEQVNALLAMLN